MVLWLRALFSGQGAKLVGALTGLALTVALLGSLGTFVVSSSRTMVQRTVAALPVDWQVLIGPGGDTATVARALSQTVPVQAMEELDYANIAGLVAKTGNTTQTTGPGVALGMAATYPARFPGQIRLLTGSWHGNLIFSQTASNLHVVPGDTVTVERIGVPPLAVRISGVVALPNADSLFQAIGVPKGIAPQAPPDNVLILAPNEWHKLFDPQGAVRPDTLHRQLHLRLTRDTLPGDPTAAFVQIQRLANNFEARVAGSAAVGNNLAARLDGVRADSLYARILFLFLGLPGALLALLVTLAIAWTGSSRRQREQALLRLRGASLTQVLQLAWVEAFIMGGLGVIGGILLTVGPASAWWSTSSASLPWPWLATAALIGFLSAIAAFLIPAWRQATHETVQASRMEAARSVAPLWQRLYLDLTLLVVGGVLFWTYTRTGYELVMAPEGVPQTSIHYEAFLGPLFLWIGAGLLWIRLARVFLGRGRRLIVAVLTPYAKDLAPLIVASLARQKDRIARGVALVALAFAFATSTAIFNATYNAQSRVDAELTNGADVTATGTTAQPAGALMSQLRAMPGVAAAVPMMHRYAYVGSDLQDLYGIDPKRISSATTLANAYFMNHDASGALNTLARTPDGVLVSEETVKDFQLKPGDQLNLRLQSAADHQYHTVPFHFVGVVREFPTAPKDSFLVANASYVARQTGSNAREVVLIRAGRNSGRVAEEARALMRDHPAIKVTTLGEVQQIISSSLTAVDVHGLTQLELGFSILMIAGVAGLILGLNLDERRRSFALLSALGANSGQIGGFLWSEAFMVVVGGAVFGISTGFGLAHVLVAILAGAFDPPPEALSIPWSYLAVTVIAGLVSGALATGIIQKLSNRPDLEVLRGG